MGAFAGEEVSQGEFIHEYKGELLSDKEANKRGSVYDKIHLSYLFDTQRECVIDPFFAGNKLRYVNHGDPANCVAKVLFVEGSFRIGFFSLRSIQVGEELFLNYGDCFSKFQHLL